MEVVCFLFALFFFFRAVYTSLLLLDLGSLSRG